MMNQNFQFSFCFANKRFIIWFLKLVPKSFQGTPRGSQRNLVEKEGFQGESSLRCLNCCFIKKLRKREGEAEKEQKSLKVAQLVLKPKLFWGLDLSQGWTCLGFRLVQALWAWTCLQDWSFLGFIILLKLNYCC